MRRLLAAAIIAGGFWASLLRSQPAEPLNLAIDAETVLTRLDDNTAVGSISYEAVMRISIGGQIREKQFTGYARGGDSAYVEFTAPARDRGTRFLKLGPDMWMWIPRVGKSTKLSGHLLRQSLMGSDFSYSDATDNTRLEDEYEADLVGVDTVEGRAAYVLDLASRGEEIDYGRQKLWVSVADYIPLRVEFYAHSGKLLKQMQTERFERVRGRNFPTRVRMTNLLRRDTYTVMEFTGLSLDVAVPSEVFTKGYLER